MVTFRGPETVLSLWGHLLSCPLWSPPRALVSYPHVTSRQEARSHLGAPTAPAQGLGSYGSIPDRWLLPCGRRALQELVTRGRFPANAKPPLTQLCSLSSLEEAWDTPRPRPAPGVLGCDASEPQMGRQRVSARGVRMAGSRRPWQVRPTPCPARTPVDAVPAQGGLCAPLGP